MKLFRINCVDLQQNSAMNALLFPNRATTSFLTRINVNSLLWRKGAAQPGNGLAVHRAVGKASQRLKYHCADPAAERQFLGRINTLSYRPDEEPKGVAWLEPFQERA